MTIVTKQHNSFPSFSGLFDDFFNIELGDWKRKNFSTVDTTPPKANIIEDYDLFRIEMAVPGLKKEDFSLSLDQNTLTISLENRQDSIEDGLKFTRQEFYYGNFQRSFTLPESVEEQEISATYIDGILKITVPKKEEAKPKPIQKINIL